MISSGGVSTPTKLAGRWHLWLFVALIAVPGLFIFNVVFCGEADCVARYHESQSRSFLWVNQWLGGWPGLWGNITELGDALILFPLLSFLIIIKPQTWAALFAAVPLSATLSLGGKSFASIPRPAAVLDPELITVVGPTLTSSNSLPSGHTITAFAIVTVVAGCSFLTHSHKGKRYLWLVGGFIIAALIGLSRMVVGAHWPMDVVMGACLGTAGGASGIALVHHYDGWWRWLESRQGHQLFGVIMALWSWALLKESLSNSQGELIVSWIAASFALSVSLYLLLNPPMFDASGRQVVTRTALNRAA